MSGTFNRVTVTSDGGKLTITCPPWCTEEHEAWFELGDNADDTFHVSESISITPLGKPVPGETWRHMQTRLMMHSTETRPDSAVVYVHLDEFKDRASELDVAGVDDLLMQVDAYRTRLVEMRDTLATIHKEWAQQREAGA